MLRKWPLPPAPPPGLPTCFHPGCRAPAAYGYGCTLRSFGQHFCEAHRPDRPARTAADPTRRAAP